LLHAYSLNLQLRQLQDEQASLLKFILSQHLKGAKGNSESQFGYLVSRTYIASL